MLCTKLYRKQRKFILQIKSMIETYQKYNVLKTSRIQGISEVYDKLKNIFETFIKDRPNIMIEDKTFGEDSVRFDAGIEEWKIHLKNHIHEVFVDIPDFGNKIELLKRCEKLHLDGLELDGLYFSLSEDINDRNYYF